MASGASQMLHTYAGVDAEVHLHPGQCGINLLPGRWVLGTVATQQHGKGHLIRLQKVTCRTILQSVTL